MSKPARRRQVPRDNSPTFDEPAEVPAVSTSEKDTLLPYPNQLSKQRSSSSLGGSVASSQLHQPASREELEEQRKPYWRRKETIVSWAVAGALVGMAAVVRFSGIGWPNSVVFDEVHFGKFAAYYIQREYYFDVHPPLSKMLLGLAGWLAGFDGSFEFTNIADPYLDVEAGIDVPYRAMRSMPAVFGSLTVGVVYWIMRESGYPIIVAAFSAGLVLFDNLHVVETRLILLDGALILSMALSLLSYIKFHQQRYRSFTPAWWMWLSATGFWLACTLGCKMVGLFTFLTVGTAVAWDLWDLMNVKRRSPLTMEQFSKHLLARVSCLILLPFCVYLSFFWIHFKILKFSGTGDSFMSAAFQETLQGNELLLHAQELRYYDIVTIKHKDTGFYLHTHAENYPLKYDDGRISSQGRQVTGYPFNDTNNNWAIMPTKILPESGRGRVARNNDVIQLYHPGTDAYLMTHDVASPLTTTNQEYTTWPKDDLASRYNDTKFRVVLNEGHEGEPLKTKSGWFKLVHESTGVSMQVGSALPDWGFKQQEVNGQKNLPEKSTTWFVEEILMDESGFDFKNRTGEKEPSPVVPMNFFKKFFELQVLMLQHNAGLTASHPYASFPVNWPFDLSGISFWTENDLKMQVYAIGNIVGFWICVLSLSVFVGIVGADQLARRRGVEPIEDHLRERLYHNTGFFLIAWAYHYFPFYLMSRQLFIHHYLPAHLASACLAGSILNFVLTESINYPASAAGPTTRLRPRIKAVVPRKAYVAFAALSVAVVGMFLHLAPFTYGTALPDPAQILRRKLLSTWILHFEK